MPSWNSRMWPGGNFWMGSPADEKDRDAKGEEQKEVTIAEDFYLGIYEVTQEQWEAVMGKGKNPSHFSRTGEGKNKVKNIKDDELKEFPVDSVSWEDIQEFLKKLKGRCQIVGQSSVDGSDKSGSD